MEFKAMTLPAQADAVAPDSSEVRILPALADGGMAHFKLRPGQVSTAVTHRTIEDIWYFLSGEGQMWRRHGAVESVLEVSPGMCLTIPLGTRFQFRASEAGPLEAVPIAAFQVRRQ